MFGRFEVAVALGLVSLGCAAAPPGPRGPLSEEGVQFALDWSLAVAAARYSRAPGQGSVESSSDYYGANLPLPPRRLEARLAPVSWADIGADLGWIDRGADVRFGMPAAAGRFFAGNVALGLRSGPTLKLVVIPQAMRVIIPPLTSQYLNLVKNSSLAVAIGYPDLTQVFMGTVLNQTGQAVEMVSITMAVYLTISLVTSFAMNIYNKRMALVER